MKRTLKILLCLLLLLSLHIPVCQGMPAPVTKFKTIPIEQWNRLETNNNLLVAKLNLLEMNLLALEKPTKELQLLLTQCRNDLTISQAKLKDAETSLANAETLLKIAQVSFKRLEDRVEVEREEALKREREAYKKGWLNGFCAGAIGATILVNHKK